MKNLFFAILLVAIAGLVVAGSDPVVIQVSGTVQTTNSYTTASINGTVAGIAIDVTGVSTGEVRVSTPFRQILLATSSVDRVWFPRIQLDDTNGVAIASTVAPYEKPVLSGDALTITYAERAPVTNSSAKIKIILE